jgi:hypothetical protein
VAQKESTSFFFDGTALHVIYSFVNANPMLAIYRLSTCPISDDVKAAQRFLRRP